MHVINKNKLIFCLFILESAFLFSAEYKKISMPKNEEADQVIQKEIFGDFELDRERKSFGIERKNNDETYSQFHFYDFDGELLCMAVSVFETSDTQTVYINSSKFLGSECYIDFTTDNPSRKILYLWSPGDNNKKSKKTDLTFTVNEQTHSLKIDKNIKILKFALPADGTKLKELNIKNFKRLEKILFL